MKHGLLTNKVCVQFDYEKIESDFDIFVVRKESKDFYKTNILDIPSVSYKALAVQYSFGANAFVLFQKGTVDELTFRMDLQEEFKDVTVQRVNAGDKERREKYYFYDRYLAQLLINSVRTPRSEEFTYHNLTGKLYYLDNAWKKKTADKKKTGMFYALKAELTSGMFLNFSVQTFTLRQNGDFVFDDKTGMLRKRLKSDRNADFYAQKSYGDKHNTVPFLDFKTLAGFERSKLGVMRRFLNDVQKKLGEYMKLTLQLQTDVNTYDIPKSRSNAVKCDILGKLINQRGVCIVDEVNTDESIALAKRLTDELKQFYGISAIGGSFQKDAYNICIIHEKSYYEEHKITDPHKGSSDGMIVQHVTVEQKISGEKSNAATPFVNKILQELVMKNDVIHNRVTIFDWKNLSYQKAWNFVIRDKIKQEYDENRKPHINFVGESVYDCYNYCMVTILPDGEMCFINFSDNQTELTQVQKNVIRNYERLHMENRKHENEVEGLVFSSPDNIHGIIRTPMSTLPDIDNLWNGLNETLPNAQIKISVLSDALLSFKEYYPEYTGYAEYMEQEFSDYGDVIKKSDIRRIMDYSHHKKAAISWNRFLYKNFGILIMPEIKNQDFENEYLLENILDIKYYMTACNDKAEFWYFAGTKRAQLQTSVHNACAVRKVIADGTNEFECLLPLMAVDFVRNNQHTVRPFPFKYLREYRDMLNI